jgi:hypothetical protein
MNENYEKIYFVCDMETYAKVGQAMKGLDAVEMETTFDQSVYFFVLIHPKDLDEFKRRLAEN